MLEKQFMEYSSFSDDENEVRNQIRYMEKNNKMFYQAKLQELRTAKKNEKTEYEYTSSDAQEFIVEEEKDVEEFDISFYQQLLESCPNIEQLPHYLPKRNSYQFQTIMNLLIAGILKEIMEIQEFILEESLSHSDKEEFLMEIHEKRSLMDYMMNYRDTKILTEEEQETSEKENTLVYLTSSSGNYYALSDFKNIDIDYYESFLELLQSIKDGTFKNVKTLKYNSDISNKIAGLSEVKNFKTRIVFKRMENDVYVILSMFMKKTDRNLVNREHLINRILKLENSFDFIKKSLAKEEYLEENKKVTEELERLLKKGEMSYGIH